MSFGMQAGRSMPQFGRPNMQFNGQMRFNTNQQYGGFGTGRQQPQQQQQQQKPQQQQQQQQQNKPSNTPAAASQPATKWTTHVAPDGRNYYHNKETGVSTYDKPDELKSNDEKEAPQCAWKEFTAPGGKKYYYNSLTKKSEWAEPEEHKQMRLKLEEAAAAKAKAEAEAAASANAVSTDTPAVTAEKPVKRDKRKKTVSYATLELARAAFDQLMLAKGVNSKSTWKQCMRLIKHDPRWGALKTNGQKKRLLQSTPASEGG